MVNRKTQVICSLLLNLLCAGYVFCVEKIEYAETGKNYTFEPKITGTSKGILWKRNNDKVVEFDDGVLTWFQFKDRERFLDKDTGDFTLTQLQKIDSGVYESQILVKDKIQTTSITLKVIGGLINPKVTCTISTNGERILQCSMPNLEWAEFEWSVPGGKAQGESLNVSQDTERESVYYCIVKNQVSQNSTLFTLKDCYKEPDVSNLVIAVCVLVPLILLGGLAVAFRNKIRAYLPVSTK